MALSVSSDTLCALMHLENAQGGKATRILVWDFSDPTDLEHSGHGNGTWVQIGMSVPYSWRNRN